MADLIDIVCKQAAARRAHSPPPTPSKQIPLRVRLAEEKAAQEELERERQQRRAHQKELTRKLFPDGEPKKEKPEPRLTRAQAEDVHFAMVDEFEQERRMRGTRSGNGEDEVETRCRIDALNEATRRMWHRDSIADSAPRYVDGFPVREFLRHAAAPPRYSTGGSGGVRSEDSGLEACARCVEVGMWCSRQVVVYVPASWAGGDGGPVSNAAQRRAEEEERRRMKREEPCSRCVRAGLPCGEYTGPGTGTGTRNITTTTDGRGAPRLRLGRKIVINGIEVEADRLALPMSGHVNRRRARE